MEMALRAGFEPATCPLGGGRAIQLCHRSVEQGTGHNGGKYYHTLEVLRTSRGMIPQGPAGQDKEFVSALRGGN